jgi:endo-1,4-beta-D-glucanase Y
MRKFVALIILTACLICEATALSHYPFPCNAKYAFGIKPNIPRETLNHNTQTAFEDWRSRYLTNQGCPPSIWRVHRYTAYDFDTVSEGIGWGMLILVLMENDQNQTQKYFDGLWGYHQSYLNKYGLMSWWIDKNGQVKDQESATEADENIAMALLYADKQWGSAGKINYRAEAENLIRRILSFEVEENTCVIKLGCEWGGSAITDPTYFDPAFYAVWSNFDARWSKVKQRGFALFDIFYAKYATGLFPDWCNANGAATQLSYNYTYDACQVPMKIGLNYLWWGEGDKHLVKLMDWIIQKTGGDPAAIVDGYALDGKTVGKYHNAAFVAPLCVAAMTSKDYQSYLDKLYTHLAAMETGGNWGYYQDTLRLMSLLIVSGNMPNYWMQGF